MQDLTKLLPLLKDKYIELYVGSTFEELHFTDHSKTVDGAIYGKLNDVVGDFLIIDSFFIDRKDPNVIKTGNILLINSWSVIAISIIDGAGSLEDALLSVSHVHKIKAILNVK